MATDLTYNGVTLHNVLTKQWDQETVYDESGTDAMFVRVKLRVEGLLHSQGVANLYGSQGVAGEAPCWIGIDEVPASVIGGFNDVARRLWMPRKALVLSIGGQTILAVDPADASGNNRDVDNGPKPKDLQVVQVVGSKVLRLSFTIEAAVVACPNGTTCFVQTPDVLNNRWSIQETMDDKFFTSRTIRGKLRISNPNFTPEAYRAVVIPALEPGFKRERIEFTVNANGLEAEYTVTDKQVYESAPWPAVSCDGMQSFTTADGLTQIDEVTIRLEGHPGSDRTQLLVRCIQIIEARLGDLTKLNMAPADDKDAFRVVENASITSPIGQANWISATLRIRSAITKMDWSTFANLPVAKIDLPLKLPPLNGHNYNSKISSAPATWGYNSQGGEDPRQPAAGLFLLRCYLQNPCDGGSHPIGTAGTTTVSPGETPPKNETEISGYQSSSTTLTSPGDNLSDNHRTAPYTICTEERTYYKASCRVQMPLSKEADDKSTCVVVKLGPDQARMEVMVEHERVGALPQIPEPKDEYTNSAGIKGSILKHWMRVQPPTTLPGSTGTAYRVAAYYLYALSRMPTADEELHLGKLPAVQFQKEQTTVRVQDVYEGKMPQNTETPKEDQPTPDQISDMLASPGDGQ